MIFFEMMRRGLMAKCAMMRKYTFLSLFSINSYFETEPDIQSIIQPDVQDAAKTTLEMLLSILNRDFIRKDIEFVRIYKEILYASEGMLKSWYRAGNYDVTVFEREYLEMINHWEMVYGKGRKMTENSYKTRCGCIHYFVNIIDKQKITLVFLPGLTADHRLFEKQTEYFEETECVLYGMHHHMHYPDHLRIITVCLTWQKWLDKILTKRRNL